MADGHRTSSASWVRAAPRRHPRGAGRSHHRHAGGAWQGSEYSR
jgi:hypothetical protein